MNFKPFEIQMMSSRSDSNNESPGSQHINHSNGTAESRTRERVFATSVEPARFEPTIRRWIEELEEAVVVLDCGVIVETNSRAPSLFGPGAGSIVGSHIKELVTEDSLMRLAQFLEFDDPEPTVLLGLRQDRRTFPLQLKAVASIIGNGRRLRVTSLSRRGAVEKAVEETTTPSPST